IQTANNLDKWATLLSNYFVPVEANGSTADDELRLGETRFFHASIYGRQWGATTLAQLAMETHAVARTCAVGDDAVPCVKLNIQGAGRGIIMQDGKEAVLEAGCFEQVDSGRLYSVVYDGNSGLAVVPLPRHLLHVPMDAVEEHSLVPFSKVNP